MNVKSAATLGLIAAIPVAVLVARGFFDADEPEGATGAAPGPDDAGIETWETPEDRKPATLVNDERGDERVAAGPEPEPGGADEEPTDDELLAYQRMSPEGVLEGVVLLGSARVPGAEVHLWNALTDPRKTNAPGEAVGTWRGETDAAGEFAFEGLDEGTYRACVVLPGGASLDAQDALRPGRKRERLIIAFGSGTIEGTVYDEFGTPVPSIYVRAVRQATEPGGFAKAAWTVTDSSGTYRLEGLRGGRYRVYAEPDRTARPGSGEMVPVELELGGTASTDFGQPEGLPVWSGVVRDSTGAIVEGARRVYLLHADDRLAATFETEPQGAFRERVPAGTLRVAVDAGYRVELGEREFGTEDVHGDVAIRGARVDVHLEQAAGAEPSDDLAARGEPRLVREGWDSPYPPPYRDLVPVARRGSTLTFLAVDPGPHRIVGEGFEATFDVPADESLFETWVTVE